MQDKIFTVAILGCGNRGAESYGVLMNDMSDKFKIVALCDLLPEKLKLFGERFDVPENARFDNPDEFFKERRADVLVLATLDDSHVELALRAMPLGYDIMLEKPITDKKDECYAMLEAQKKYGNTIFVCHVLRYAKAFSKVKELMDEGAVGKLVSIQALEQVSYWHQAHSYVRGNWRNLNISAPMILAKCCHDLDLLQYYAGSPCLSLSSVGDLTFFKKENQPEGASDRCLDCKYIDTCPYSAKKIYIDEWHRQHEPYDRWPFGVVTVERPLTEKAITEALKEGNYGKCVFDCDNDVVDHQLTQITFENGVKATLTMTGFTHDICRIIKFYGTHGELVLDEGNGVIEVKSFGKEKETISIAHMNEGGHSHGGGDLGIILALYDMLAGKSDMATTLTSSIESHLMGICAEESRLDGGKLIYVHE